MINDFLEKAREKYFFEHSQSRRLRRKMAKELRIPFDKDVFPPYNKPMNLGINEFKRQLKNTALNSSDKHKAVVQYKMKAYKTFAKAIKES